MRFFPVPYRDIHSVSLAPCVGDSCVPGVPLLSLFDVCLSVPLPHRARRGANSPPEASPEAQPSEFTAPRGAGGPRKQTHPIATLINSPSGLDGSLLLNKLVFAVHMVSYPKKVQAREEHTVEMCINFSLVGEGGT